MCAHVWASVVKVSFRSMLRKIYVQHWIFWFKLVEFRKKNSVQSYGVKKPRYANKSMLIATSYGTDATTFRLIFCRLGLLMFYKYKIIKNEVGCRDDTVPNTVDTRRHCEEE